MIALFLVTFPTEPYQVYGKTVRSYDKPLLSSWLLNYEPSRESRAFELRSELAQALHGTDRKRIE